MSGIIFYDYSKFTNKQMCYVLFKIDNIDFE
jgi:hypothetical protein